MATTPSAQTLRLVPVSQSLRRDGIQQRPRRSERHVAGTYTATDSVLWERTRELATLRTLEFGMGRIAVLVTVENVAVAAFGALAGLVPGRMLAQLLIQLSQTEGFSLRAITLPGTYALAVVGSLVLTVIAQGPGLRRIAKLDLAEAVRLRDE